MKRYHQANFLPLGICVVKELWLQFITSCTHTKHCSSKDCFGLCKSYSEQMKPLRHPFEKEWCCPPTQRDGNQGAASSRSHKSRRWQNPEQQRQLLWAMSGLLVAGKLEKSPVKGISFLTHSNTPAEIFCAPACWDVSLPVFAVLLTVRACRDGASTRQPRGWAGASWCSAGPEAGSTTV